MSASKSLVGPRPRPPHCSSGACCPSWFSCHLSESLGIVSPTRKTPPSPRHLVEAGRLQFHCLWEPGTVSYASHIAFPAGESSGHHPRRPCLGWAHREMARPEMGRENQGSAGWGEGLEDFGQDLGSSFAACQQHLIVFQASVSPPVDYRQGWARVLLGSH